MLTLLEHMLIFWGINYHSYIRVKEQYGKACVFLLAGFMSLIILALIGHYHMTQELSEKATAKESPEKIFDRWLREELFHEVDSKSIWKFLKVLTKEPHVAGTDANHRVADFIASTWRAQGLQGVHFAEYDVLLSYPNFERPNTITIIDKAGTVQFHSTGVSPALLPSEQGDHDAAVRFNGYAAPGLIEGHLVYCNYGTKRDYKILDKNRISLKGRIAIIRYGKGFRGAKVALAQTHGAQGVILYTDPGDEARGVNVYPASVWMSRDGAQRGTLQSSRGDPLTPFYPAKNYTFRSVNVTELKKQGVIPSIPVLPMSYGDAYHLLERMGGRAAPDTWQGGFNFTYNLGPGFVDRAIVRMEVQSRLERKRIQNVIGRITGRLHPDSYVILGNHFDAWTYGAVDPNSGTAVMLEMSRVFSYIMNQTNWRPARTIVFCAWDAEEYGLIGSTEWVEEHLTELKHRAVAYVNLDLVPGNVTLHVETIPSLYRLAMKSAQVVSNPRRDEKKAGRPTVYDTWIRSAPGKLPWAPEFPKMPVPGDGSDHASFLKFAGIPVIDFYYANKSASSGALYPLYHTLYETKFLVKELMDIDHLSVHVAVAQFWMELIRNLADRPLIPFNFTDLAHRLEDYLKNTEKDMAKAKAPEEAMMALASLNNSLQNLKEEAEVFHGNGVNATEESEMTEEDVFLQRRKNNRLGTFERCFLNPRGTPDDPTSRHVLYGTNKADSYASAVFPGIYEALNRMKMGELEAGKLAATKELMDQISIVEYSVRCGIQTLKIET